MNRAEFFKIIRPMFAGKKLSVAQVQRIEAVLNGLDERRIPIGQAAYIMATAHWETDQWRTMEEYASGAAYEWRDDLGNNLKGDGVRFKGRGLLMLTGRRNYVLWSKRLGVDFVANPSRVSDLENAVPILIEGMLEGTSTGKKLGAYVDGPKRDFINARRVVNGTDKAHEIADIALKYYNALFGAGFGVYGSLTEPKEPTGGSDTKNAINALVRLLTALVAVIKRIFRKE